MAATVKKRTTKKVPAARARRAPAKKRQFISPVAAWVAIFAGLCIVFLVMAAITYLR